MSSLVILDSDINELKDIDRRLSDDDMRCDLDIELKLRYLWRKLVRAEFSLESTLDDLNTLRDTHTKDNVKIQLYLSSIQCLSDEQKSLINQSEREKELLRKSYDDLSISFEELSFSNTKTEEKLGAIADVYCKVSGNDTDVNDSVDVAELIEKLIRENEKLEKEISERTESDVLNKNKLNEFVNNNNIIFSETTKDLKESDVFETFHYVIQKFHDLKIQLCEKKHHESDMQDRGSQVEIISSALLEKIDKEKVELNSKLRKLEEEKTIIVNKHMLLQEDIESMKDIYNKQIIVLKTSHQESLKKQADRFQIELDAVEDERDRYNKHVKEIKMLREKNLYLEKENKLLQHEQTSEESKKLMIAKTEFENKLNIQERYLEEKDGTIKNLCKELDDLKVQLNVLQVKVKDARKDRKKLQQKLSLSRLQLSELKKKFYDLDTAYKDEMVINENGFQQYKELRKHHEQVKENLNLAKRNLSLNEKEIGDMKKNMKTMEDSLARRDEILEKLNNKYKKKLKKIEESNIEKTKQIAKLELQLEAVKTLQKELMDKRASEIDEDKTRNRNTEGEFHQVQSINSDLKNTLKAVIQELNEI